MDETGLAIGCILFVVLAFTGIYLVGLGAPPQTAARTRFLFLTAMAIRFAFSIVIYQIGLVRYLGDEDSTGWVVGRAFAEQWAQSGATIFEVPLLFAETYQHHHYGYYYLLGVYFFVTGSASRLSAAALNCFFGALIVTLGRATALRLFSERIADRVGWWMCFFPSLVIWSAQTVKEPVVILLESATIYACISLFQGRSALLNVIIITLSILLLVPFRFYAAYLAGITVALSFCIRALGAGRQFSLFPVIGSCVITALAGVLALNLLVRERDREIMQQYDLQGIERFRDGVISTSKSGVNVGYGLRTVEGFTGSLIVGGLHLLLAPFPWQLATGSLRMLLVTPEVVLWWWLLFTGVIPGLRHLLRTRFRDILPLLIAVVGLGSLYALMFSNIGLVYRQRAQLLPWLLIFAVVGQELTARRRESRRLAQMSTPALS